MTNSQKPTQPNKGIDWNEPHEFVPSKVKGECECGLRETSPMHLSFSEVEIREPTSSSDSWGKKKKYPIWYVNGATGEKLAVQPEEEGIVEWFHDHDVMVLPEEMGSLLKIIRSLLSYHQEIWKKEMIDWIEKHEYAGKVSVIGLIQLLTTDSK